MNGAVTGHRRVAASSVTMAEALQRNAQHFKRFYGADKPKNILF
jgi:hypothetical protein